MKTADYIELMSSPLDGVLDAIERWAHLHTAQPQMLCGRYEGQLLTMMCRSQNAKCAVEIGAFVGYSTICLARGLADGGVLHSFEINEEYEEVIRRHLSMAGVDNCVNLHIGDAKKLIPQLLPDDCRNVDLAFIDADKRHTKDYYDMLVPCMRRGGLIVVDNVLWGGKVLDLECNKDFDTQYIHAFNEYVKADKRVENILLDVRDGLMICVVL
ncbi:MAG: O-methyltransferase [Bacteroidales bacterium]|nr:O-methyltransferase [Bacteroidales bacterium]